VLRRRSVPADRDFFELGGNSVSVLELRQRIHETFGVELPIGVLFEAPTVQRLVGALEPSLDPLAPAFVSLRSGRSDLSPLLCLMGVMLYRSLADALSTERAVYGLHIPQRVGGAGPLPTVEQLASAYVDLILQRVPTGPYHLLGLCFGGLITFEVARQLTERGFDVKTVAIIDAALPRGERQAPWRVARRFLGELRARPHATFELLRDSAVSRARQLPSLAALLERRRKAAESGEQELDVLSPVARIMVDAYDEQSRRFRGSMHVFRAGSRRERPWRVPRWDLGWSTLADHVEVHEISGSHLEMLEPPHVQAIAAALTQTLA
jgi:thioesterase domain-containing protein/acyl carrier protein